MVGRFGVGGTRLVIHIFSSWGQGRGIWLVVALRMDWVGAPGRDWVGLGILLNSGTTEPSQYPIRAQAPVGLSYMLGTWLIPG